MTQRRRDGRIDDVHDAVDDEEVPGRAIRQVYAAVLQALEEANARIAADPRAAAEILLASTPDSGFSVDEIVADARRIRRSSSRRRPRT